MPPITEQTMPQGNIMIVDDNPANLKLLEDTLRQHGHEIRAFPRGRLALAAAEFEPPDLILLDITMPEMNGYEVCEKLKSSESLAEIPVIFLSALNDTEDKVKGFRAGAVDYISKPFQFEEVHARVKTHLQLRFAQKAERDLLERTLSGAVNTLWELAQLTAPMLAVRARTIRDIVLWISKRIVAKDPWQYELAATLSLMGCLALPDEVFEKAWSGGELTAEEDRMFRAHPETAARLIAKIPRMEIVAEIIRRQIAPDMDPPVNEQTRLGAHMLHLAIELDSRVYRGMLMKSALAELRMSRRYDARMTDVLENYSPGQAEYEVRRLPVRELSSGMILERDVVGKEDLLILKQGTVLTETWIERLENFARTWGSQDLLDVRIPKSELIH